jgi:hypothetical protein
LNGFEFFNIIYLLKVGVDFTVVHESNLNLNFFATRKNIKPTKRLVNKKVINALTILGGFEYIYIYQLQWWNKQKVMFLTLAFLLCKLLVNKISNLNFKKNSP